MDASHIALSTILENNVQFRIPIYQRSYDWQREHCRQLYDDIVKIGRTPEKTDHFIGAITTVGKSTMANVDVKPFQVIDGQQRITTVMLLLRALRDSLDDSAKIVTAGKIDQLLCNINEDKNGGSYHKLVLTEDDDLTFRDILKDGKSEESNSVSTNFRYFVRWISEDPNPDVLWTGIKKLTIVQILIDEKDDAQAIFESMNSTGLSLSDTDMIQNYLLMSDSIEWQKKIYQDYWRPMERRFGAEHAHFDEFIRNYLMMHRGQSIPKNAMYAYFKEHMANLDKEDEIRKINEYSKYYVLLIGMQPHSSARLQRVIGYISQQGTSVAHSLLLKVLADNDHGIIDEKESEKIFLLVDNYLLRCHVCETTKGANKVFPEIIPKIDSNQYLKSIEVTLMSKTGNRRFPRDVTFREKLVSFPLYTNRTICKYVLDRLERHKDDREQIKTDDLQIEHIMPQSLTKYWERDLGDGWRETHEKYVHTLGNLTLTGYNPSLSNAPFSVKLDTYKNSKIQITKELETYDTWNEESIKNRMHLLTENSLRVWPCPDGYSESMKETLDDETLEKEHLEGKKIHGLWKMLKEKIMSSCDGVVFGMTRIYATFRLPTKDDAGSVIICSLEARKDKIHCTYNAKIQDGVISPSGFVRDVSNVGHYAVGELRSTIMTEQDIGRVVSLIKRVYDEARY